MLDQPAFIELTLFYSILIGNAIIFYKCQNLFLMPVKKLLNAIQILVLFLGCFYTTYI